ncbi:MAG: hypothetical protein KDC12_10020 [Flavobacteriales bacterium]|nr:hypothetical protein [Flavobacteriales bacterium]
MTNVRLAVNIALVPRPEYVQPFLEFNRALQIRGEEQIVLGAECCVPHLTIAMAVLTQGEREEVHAYLNTLNQNIEVTFNSLQIVQRAPDQLVHWMPEDAAHLTQLHGQVKSILPAEPHLANATHFSTPVNESTIQYVRKFSQGELPYVPHVTMGYGEWGMAPQFPHISTWRWGMFELGNHCTCRREIL